MHWTTCKFQRCETHLDSKIQEDYETDSAPELNEETGPWEIVKGT